MARHISRAKARSLSALEKASLRALEAGLDQASCELVERREEELKRLAPEPCPECNEGSLISKWDGAKCNRCSYWFCF